MRVLIVGCGYVGLPLGATLARQGHEVYGLRRGIEAESELQAAGIHPLVGDVSRREDLTRLPGPFDWVVNTVSSSKGGLDVYRAVYVEGNRNLVEWLAPTPVRKFVYTSSTSVYGQTDASLVTERDPASPATPTGMLLVEAERILLEAARVRAFPAVILRVAGIYGPGRGHLFQQYLRGEARFENGGERWINMIHRDDLVTCLIAALERGRPGERYNATDDQPITQRAFLEWLAMRLGKTLPPAADSSGATLRKRGTTNKRVSNQKLKAELGVALRYPNYQAGYEQEIHLLTSATTGLRAKSLPE